MWFDWQKINWLKIVNTTLIVVFIFLILFFTRFDQVSWNDGSRYATIQNLVENHSFKIDQSMFFTFDRVQIGKHFYSDKPPLLSLMAAAPYYFFHARGRNLADHPRSYVYVTNLFVLMLPLVIFVFLLYYFLQKSSGLSKDKSLLLSLLFCLGSVLLPFATVLNNHLPAALLVGVAALILFYKIERISYKLLFLSGLLLGFGVAFDLGVDFIAISCFLYILFLKGLNKQNLINLFYYSFGLLIPILIHWYINRGITGDIFPASMHPEFFTYVGSKFTQDNLTSAGLVIHSFSQWIQYIWLMTFGRRGFFLHNPLLLLGLLLSIVYRFKGEKKLKYFSISVIFSVISVILYYSLYGQGAGGGSYTVRWFVILTPLFFPIIAHWALQNKNNFKIVVVFAAVSFIINILAVGNVIGPNNDYTKYSLVNMASAFPKYLGNQCLTWSEMLKIK